MLLKLVCELHWFLKHVPSVACLLRWKMMVGSLEVGHVTYPRDHWSWVFTARQRVWGCFLSIRISFVQMCTQWESVIQKGRSLTKTGCFTKEQRANPVLHFQELCLEAERRWDIMSGICCQQAGIRMKVGPQICVGVTSKLAPFTLCWEALHETQTRQKPCAGLQDAHCSAAYASSKLSAGLAAQSLSAGSKTKNNAVVS